MYRLLEGQLYYPANMNHRVFEYEQNILKDDKLHHKCHGKLETGIESRMSNTRRGKNPKRHLPGRFTLATIICFSKDANQPQT